jgi:hypothetical protein
MTDWLYVQPGSHLELIGGSRAGKAYINSLYGKARTMEMQVNGYDVNMAMIWQMKYLNGRWYGTSLKDAGFMVFISRQNGIEYFLSEYMYPRTDKITALDKDGRFYDAYPRQFESNTLSNWVEAQLTKQAREL